MRSSLSRRLRQWPAVHRAARTAAHALEGAWWSAVRAATSLNTEVGPPRGWFSAREGVERGTFPGRVLRPGREVVPAAADSLRVRAGLVQEKLGSWPVFWSRHRDARLVGRSLALVDERKRVCFESVYGPICLRTDPATRYWRLPPAVRLEGAWTSVVSWWSTGFYHWFMDVLPRLSLLGEFAASTRILVPPLTMPCQAETLDWLGVSGRCVPTTAMHLRVEDYYFAAPTAMTGGSDAYAVEFLRAQFLGRAESAFVAPRKVFVHRVGSVRGIVNEAEVLDFVQQRGWTVVDTAAMPMARQIALFAGADAVCALHGAALVNLLWCQPGCRVFELVPSTYLNGVYEGLAAMVGARHRYEGGLERTRKVHRGLRVRMLPLGRLEARGETFVKAAGRRRAPASAR